MGKFNLFSILPLFLGAAISVPASAELITASDVIVLQTSHGKSFYNNFHASDGTGSNSWVTTDPNGPNGNDYYDPARPQPNPILLFDLTTNQTLDSLALWNYGGGNAVKDFTLYFYDGNGFSGTPTTTQKVTLSRATGNGEQLTINLDSPVTARWVKMELTDNFFGAGHGGGDRVGIGELQFNRTNTVTEIRPTSAVFKGTSHGEHPDTNLIDGDASSKWCTNATASDGYYTKYAAPELEFTFDGTQKLSSITVTPYADVPGNSGKDFNLKFYDAAGNQITVEDESKYAFKMVIHNVNEPSLFTFPEVEGVAKVVMTITNNFKPVVGGANYSGGDRVGLNEVTFGNHLYTEGPTFQTSYNEQQPGLDVIRPDSVSINNSSLSGTNVNNLLGGSGYSRSGQWYTIDRRDPNNKVYPDYFAVPDEKYVNPTLSFDVDQEILAEGFLLWGYGGSVSGNCLTEFEMTFYEGDEVVYADTYIIDRAFGQNEFASFMFDEALRFDSVDLTILDNAYGWHNSGGGGDRIGFNGLAFYQDPNKVPEPSTFVLLAGGIFALGAAAVRKKRAEKK